MLYIIGKGSHSDVVIGAIGITQPYAVLSIEDFQTKLSSFKTDDSFICAIGDNETRKQIVESSQSHIRPSQWANAIHPSAIVDRTVQLGFGNVVCAGSVLQTNSSIGNHCIINTNASIDHHCKLHDFVHVAPNVAVCGSVTIGQGSFIATSSSVMPKLVLAPWTFIKAGTIVKHSTGPIPMYKPYMKKSFVEHIQTVVEEGALTFSTPHNSFVKRGETLLATMSQCKYAILMNNGTSATHCLYLALKYKYPTLSKIYVPNYVYVAVWNTALYEYDKAELQVLPIDPVTLNIPQTPEFLKTLDKNAALVVVHNVGNVVDVPLIKRLRPDLVVVEDNCEGFFGKYYDDERKEFMPTGSASLCSSISFFANKTLTCGEGGAFLTNDEDVHAFIRKVYNQGMTQERYVHDVIGYNYRITNVQAALLYPQLEEHQHILDKKQQVFDLYKKLISHSNVSWIASTPNTMRANWMIILRVKNSTYEQALRFFGENLIEVRPFFYEITRHSHLRDISYHSQVHPQLLNQTELLMLPSYPMLQANEIKYICEKVNEYADMFTLNWFMN